MLRPKKAKDKIGPHSELFENLKRGVSLFDPVSFAENYLLLDSGEPFDLSSDGWKYMADLYRFIALQASSSDGQKTWNSKAKPVVLLKGRQVGATTMAGVLSLFFTSSGLFGGEVGKPPMKVIHLFPTLGQMSKYSKDKLDPTIRNSRDNFLSQRSLRFDPNLVGSVPEDTLTEKSFIGDNKLRIDSIGKDADRIRGITEDIMLLDEVQDVPRRAIENAIRILQHAKYGAKGEGVQLFFGTPKQSGSYFWQLWNDSDQRFYQLRCTHCEEYFFLYTLEDDSWLETWVSGQEVKCPTCGFHQPKDKAIAGGRWIPTEIDKEGKRVPAPHKKANYYGFHHNIMLSPLFPKEYVLKSYPKFNPSASERAWKNEVIGDFYRGGGMPLTMDDIILNALDETRGTAKQIKDRSGKTVVLGMDWGDKDEDDDTGDGASTRGKSYTTAVVLSISQNGVYTVENAFRLKKNDIMYKVEIIDKLFKNYHIQTAVADYMWGQETVRYMQYDMNYKNRFMGCINSGNINKLFSYDPKYMRVTVNKDMMIDEIFGLIRRGKIKFPSKGLAFEQLRWLMEHCTSMETITRKKNENIVKKYIKGATPNDGLMALMYAIIAYKFLATGGFRTQRETWSDGGQRPMPLLSYAPSIK